MENSLFALPKNQLMVRSTISTSTIKAVRSMVIVCMGMITKVVLSFLSPRYSNRRGFEKALLDECCSKNRYAPYWMPPALQTGHRHSFGLCLKVRGRDRIF